MHYDQLFKRDVRFNYSIFSPVYKNTNKKT